MRDIRWRQVRESPEGYQERLLGTLDEMVAVERVAIDGAPSAIWTAFEAWQFHRAGDNVPRLGQCDLQRIVPASLQHCVSRIDAREDDCLNFVFLSHPGLSSSAPSFRSLAGRRLGENPSKMNRYALAQEYAECIRARAPFYHEISQTISGATRCYRRLLLPMADQHGNVAEIHYAVRPIATVGPSSMA